MVILYSTWGNSSRGPRLDFVVWLGLDFPLPALACSSIANSSPIIHRTSRVIGDNDGEAITILFQQKKEREEEDEKEEKEGGEEGEEGEEQ